MFREAQEAGDVVRAQRDRNRDTISGLAERLRRSTPRAVVTLARGSSDHAATFARYLVETRAGVLTSSASPSVGSIYEATPDLTDTLVAKSRPAGRRATGVGSRWTGGRNGQRRELAVGREGGGCRAPVRGG